MTKTIRRIVDNGGLIMFSDHTRAIIPAQECGVSRVWMPGMEVAVHAAPLSAIGPHCFTASDGTACHGLYYNASQHL